MMRSRTRQILLVEDNPGDVELVRASLAGVPEAPRLQVVEDGNAALAFLRGQEPYEKAQAPDLVLLDLNLPGTDGRAVLRAMRQEPELRHLPVVVLSSSAASRDVVDSYALGANAYVCKPLVFDAFRHAVREVMSFWFGIATLPDPERTQSR